MVHLFHLLIYALIACVAEAMPKPVQRVVGVIFWPLQVLESLIIFWQSIQDERYLDVPAPDQSYVDEVDQSDQQLRSLRRTDRPLRTYRDLLNRCQAEKNLASEVAEELPAVDLLRRFINHLIQAVSWQCTLRRERRALQSRVQEIERTYERHSRAIETVDKFLFMASVAESGVPTLAENLVNEQAWRLGFQAPQGLFKPSEESMKWTKSHIGMLDNKDQARIAQSVFHAARARQAIVECRRRTEVAVHGVASRHQPTLLLANPKADFANPMLRRIQRAITTGNDRVDEFKRQNGEKNTSIDPLTLTCATDQEVMLWEGEELVNRVKFSAAFGGTMVSVSLYFASFYACCFGVRLWDGLLLRPWLSGRTSVGGRSS